MKYLQFEGRGGALVRHALCTHYGESSDARLERHAAKAMWRTGAHVTTKGSISGRLRSWVQPVAPFDRQQFAREERY